MKRIRFLATTDLHGLFYEGQYTPRPLNGSIAGVREFVSSVLKDGVPTMLLDAGDFMGGGLPSFLSNHTPGLHATPHHAANIANWCGYAAMTAGNHDLDAGPEALARYIATLRAPLLAANIEGISGIKRYTAITCGDITVAIIGLLTPDDSSTTIYESASLLTLNDGVDNALAEIDADGIKPDMIVGLIHDGPDQCMRLAEKRDVFDLILCGHVHRQPGVCHSGKAIIINPGAYGQAIACAMCIISDGHIIINPQIIGLPTVSLQMPPEIIAAGERKLIDNVTHLDTLINETALRVTDADAAVTNRTDSMLHAGFTLAESFAALPYDDRICVIPMGKEEYDSLASDTSVSVLCRREASVAETMMVAMTTYQCRHLGLGQRLEPTTIISTPLRGLLLNIT